MMKEYFPHSQNHALRGLSDALVRRLLDEAKAFEVDPHRVRRIRQPPVRIGVSCQQVREFIVDDWFGNRQDRQQDGSQSHSEQSNCGYRKRSSARKPAKAVLEFLKRA
jgi:hypothetical protein